MSSGGCVDENDTSSLVICDAGPLIHLDELGCLDLLSGFREILVPDAVWQEVARHRPSALRRRSVQMQRVAVSGSPTTDLRKLADSFALAAGEIQSLILMADHSDAVLLTDDAAARLVADKLGYEVHGTVGIIVGAIAQNQRTKRQVLNLLRAIPRRSTLYIARSLLNSVIAEVTEH